MNDSRLSFYFLFGIIVYPVHSKTELQSITADSQAISQQEPRVRICCTLSINIVNACFDHRYSTAVLQTKVQNACKTYQSFSLLLYQE